MIWGSNSWVTSRRAPMYYVSIYYELVRRSVREYLEEIIIISR